ncbi:hypothetical protein Q1695_004679 [Nippostrongylus brasiliensis]|nr:hypothetical protein Q1695_004679 [Nippostrongylus brasiliensis]
MWTDYFRVRRRSVGLDRVEVEQEMRKSDAGDGVGAYVAPHQIGVRSCSGAGGRAAVLRPDKFQRTKLLPRAEFLTQHVVILHGDWRIRGKELGKLSVNGARQDFSTVVIHITRWELERNAIVLTSWYNICTTLALEHLLFILR